MSRRELVETVNAWLWDATRQHYELDAHAIARSVSCRAWRGICGWTSAGKIKPPGTFDEGELAGQEAEDPDLTAWVLATRSIGPFFAGQHQHAADLLARAEDAAALQSSPRRRAWVVALRARAAAAVGDHFQSRVALEQTQRHMRRSASRRGAPSSSTRHAWTAWPGRPTS